jgi:hypothetical protein
MNEVSECIENMNEERWLSVINKEGAKHKNGKNKLRTYKTSNPHLGLMLCIQYTS